MKRATLVLLCAAGWPAAGAADPEAVTFNRDVAPIIHRNCSSCHRPGEAGPFPLLTYDDVRKRAEQIRYVTDIGYMPPWLPERGAVAFIGERGLDASEFDTLVAWIDGGMPEGDPGRRPAPPEFAEGWQLGVPDRVVELDRPFRVPPDGQDVIRNFVLDAPVERVAWVAAVELRPGNKRVVHHAILKRDRTPYTRRLDRRDPEPGFGGMEMGNAEYPNGQIIVWTPGMVPSSERPGVAWRIDPETDLVLQLHMVPVGKAVDVQPKIGFYFTDEPPEIDPYVLLLRNDRIDIPPGVPDHVVEDTFVVPVPVTALEIYPHAHYLGKRMEVFAELPAGDRRELLTIPDWDFNWQGSYRFADPVPLPTGSRIRMRYTFDNSADNVRNPHDPPRRVTVGNRSSDEMATLALQVLTRSAADRATLRITQWEDLLKDHPQNPVGYYNLGVAYAERGDFERAAANYEIAVEVDPNDVGARFYLAAAYYKLGRVADAAHQYARVIELDPDFAEAHLVLGWIHARKGDLDRADEHLTRAIRIEPGFARAHYLLGTVRERRGRPAEARAAYRRALELDEGLEPARRRLEGLDRPGS